MDSIPLTLIERFLQWANMAYLVGLAVVLVLTVAVHYLSARVTAAKDRELEEYRTESTVKIAAAEARAAEANAVASQAQLELAQLKQPRKLAPEDQEKIVAALQQFAGQHFSFAVFADPESFAFARLIDDMLKSAGWLRVPYQVGNIFHHVAGSTAGTSAESGVGAFVGRDNLIAPPAVAALSKGLNDAGISCRKGLSEDLIDKTPKAILIVVGKKP